MDTQDTFSLAVTSSESTPLVSARRRWPACFLGELRASDTGALPGLPHFAPKAKRVIYLFQSGGPSQMELFDYKPKLKDYAGTELPESIRNGQRLTGMSASQSTFPRGTVALPIRAIWRLWRLGKRADAVHGQDRRPIDVHPFHEH